jgi:hypothetical protein
MDPYPKTPTENDMDPEKLYRSRSATLDKTQKIMMPFEEGYQPAGKFA